MHKAQCLFMNTVNPKFLPPWNYVGMLTCDGLVEHHEVKSLNPADFHHVKVIKNLDAYNRDDTLRYSIVRSHVSPYVYEILIAGSAALDPYKTGVTQIEHLATMLIERGFDENVTIIVVNHHLPHCTFLRNDGHIGCLADWCNQNSGKQASLLLTDIVNEVV